MEKTLVILWLITKLPSHERSGKLMHSNNSIKVMEVEKNALRNLCLVLTFPVKKTNALAGSVRL